MSIEFGPMAIMWGEGVLDVRKRKKERENKKTEWKWEKKMKNMNIIIFKNICIEVSTPQNATTFYPSQS